MTVSIELVTGYYESAPYGKWIVGFDKAILGSET